MSIVPVTIDAGHGGADSGAVSSDGRLKEKDIALDVSQRVFAILEKVVESSLTRKDDRFLTLSERANLANIRGAALLSIHCNSGGGTGFEAFTSPGNTSSDAWATALLEEYHREFPDLAYRKDLSDGDPDKEARFTVLTESNGPAVLFELGFIDVKDTSFLESESNKRRMAEALARGTLKHFGITHVDDNEDPATPEDAGQLAKMDEIRSRIAKLEWQLNQLKKLVS